MKDYCLFHTSTTSFMPIKAILNEKLYTSLKKYKKIIPIHLQLSLTNACPLDCSYCSFKDRNKNLELNFDTIKDIINTFVALGMEAITLTGGGDPLFHPHINDVISYCEKKSIKVAIITNGLLLEKLNNDSLNTITWCRISFDDNKSIHDVKTIKNILDNVYQKRNGIDWSFSYIVLKNQNPKIQHEIISLVKKFEMLNVRFSPNLNDIDKIDFNLLKSNNQNVGKDICIYDKKFLGEIFSECWLYLLKPFVAADGLIYPCCCYQYCSEKQDLSVTDSICSYKDFANKLNSMEPYKPQCCKCFFSHYNEYINAMLGTVKHVEWI